MAILTRAALIAKINAFITTNGNKEITGAQLNVILQDISDSGFMQLDEIRNALSVLYQNVGTPSDWNGGVAPVTQNLVNDELAQRLTSLETGNPLFKTAWVSENGSDVIGEYQVANPLKPFATFNAAISAVGSGRWKVISLGGTFTENIVIPTGSSGDFFELDLSGTFLNNSTITGGSIRGLINLQGGALFAPGGSGTAINLGAASTSFSIELQGGLIFGGVTFTGTAINLNAGAKVNGTEISVVAGTGITTGSIVAGVRAKVQNVNIYSSVTGINSVGMEITNTNVTSSSRALNPTGTTIVNGGSFICTGNTPAIAAQAAIALFMSNSYVRSELGNAMEIMQSGTGATALQVKNTSLIGQTNCVRIGTNSSPIPAGVDLKFQGCIMWVLGAGDIFQNDLGVQSGNLQSINNTYNKIEADSTNILSYNKNQIVGLQVEDR